MGELLVRAAKGQEDKNRFIKRLLNDIRAMDVMIRDDIFEKDRQRIGAEQELALITPDYSPSLDGPDLLEQIADPHFTTEIARYNLEINLDPFELRSDAFRLTERQLRQLLSLGQQRAKERDCGVLLTGILPTIRYRHLESSCMTPRVRYQVLSDGIRQMRGSNFEIHIEGVDEVIAGLDSVMFEGCNTSFQLHLQIAPEDFAAQYNWAQLIAGPVLSACTNSPLLFGRELWAETRIALFQQSIDTRSSTNHMREKQRRVRFGSTWIHSSVSELFKEQLSRFPLILTTDIEDDAMSQLQNGQIPKLKALQLHNGTVYTWNRPCYGISDTGYPHLRIENRYIPAGPTVADEMANFAFWVGLMKAMPEEYRHLPGQIPFSNLVDNFYRAARTGLDTVFDWFGRAVPAQQLLLETLLPLARSGLEKARINESDIDRYLGIIEARVSARKCGARWQINNYRRLRDRYGTGVALTELTRGIYERQQTSEPVHTWSEIDASHVYAINLEKDPVYKIMTTDLFTVREDEPLAFVKALMTWQKIRHLPVENLEGTLIGLVTASDVHRYESTQRNNNGWAYRPIRSFMVDKLITVPPEMPVNEAIQLMREHDITCLPVVHHHQMIGLVTDTDLKKLKQAETEL